MKNLFIPFLLCMLFLTSCEEQMVVIPDISTSSSKKILIEEFTGANCAACPQGAAAINDLSALYSGNIVSVAIHTSKAGVLGDPLPGSKYDFRTPFGDQIAEHLEPLSSIPAAAIDRKLFSNQARIIVAPYQVWADLVKEEVETEPEIVLNTSVDFNPDTRELDINATIIPQVDITGDLRIVCYITESHIIDKQLNGNDIVDEYENNHVLRDALTSIEGRNIANAMTKGEVIDVNIKPASGSYILPSPGEGEEIWVPENCHVVVFVTKVDAGSGGREVLQADEVDLIE